MAFLVLFGCVPSACADSADVDPATAPFMNIDPIDNHTVGEVFFINGTTNLPVNSSLFLSIDNFEVFCYLQQSHPRPDSMLKAIGSNAIIQIKNVILTPDLKGQNRFSVNVTDTIKNFEDGNYFVYACSGQVCSKGLKDNQEACNISGPSDFIPRTDFFTVYPAIKTTVSIIPQPSGSSPGSVPSTQSLSPQSPTTQKTPINIVLPVVVVLICLVLRWFFPTQGYDDNG